MVPLPAPCYWRTLSNDKFLIVEWSMWEDSILTDASTRAAHLLPKHPLGANFDNAVSTSVIATAEHFKVVAIYAFESDGNAHPSKLHLSNDLLLTPIIF
eukprot:c14066_g2_i1 orf=246-542(-)